MPRTLSVLVPLRVLEGETVSPGTVDLLAAHRVVLLGYHELPEQTPPEQARDQFEAQAQQKLDAVVEAFEAAGADPETRIVFTHDAEQTIDRVADETDCPAFLIPNPSAEVTDVLVAVAPAVDVANVVEVSAPLLAGADVDVTVFATAASEEDRAASEDLVASTREALESAGVPADRVDGAVEVTTAPVRATAEAGARHDLVVMGERAPSLRSVVFGEDPDQVAELSVGPVLVVRRLPDAETGAE
ncbi:MAG: universal stress protein [Halobacteriaceae archaeon]